MSIGLGFLSGFEGSGVQEFGVFRLVGVWVLGVWGPWGFGFLRVV